MNLVKVSYKLFFLIAVLGMLFTPFPMAFAMFWCVLLVYQESLEKALVFACLMGLFMDGLDSVPRLGIHAISFFITVRFLYFFKSYFFADEFSSIFLLTAIGSLIHYSASTFLLLAFLKKPMISLLFQGIFYALLDGTVAMLVVGIPLRLFGKRALKGREYFLR